MIQSQTNSSPVLRASSSGETSSTATLTALADMSSKNVTTSMRSSTYLPVNASALLAPAPTTISGTTTIADVNASLLKTAEYSKASSKSGTREAASASASHNRLPTLSTLGTSPPANSNASLTTAPLARFGTKPRANAPAPLLPAQLVKNSSPNYANAAVNIRNAHDSLTSTPSLARASANHRSAVQTVSSTPRSALVSAESLSPILATP